VSSGITWQAPEPKVFLSEAREANAAGARGTPNFPQPVSLALAMFSEALDGSARDFRSRPAERRGRAAASAIASPLGGAKSLLRWRHRKSLFTAANWLKA